LSFSTSGVRGTTQENVIESRLNYENIPGETIILTGNSDINHLRNMKNVLLSLSSTWLEDGNKFVIAGNQKD